MGKQKNKKPLYALQIFSGWITSTMLLTHIINPEQSNIITGIYAIGGTAGMIILTIMNGNRETE